MGYERLGRYSSRSSRLSGEELHLLKLLVAESRATVAARVTGADGSLWSEVISLFNSAIV